MSHVFRSPITTCALCVAALAPATSTAQAYPAKSVRILVGFAPGGSTDVTARIIAQELTKLWNQQVVVDNRPGASGRTRAVNRVPACGM